MASSGQPVKLSSPLDFLVVSDHSDNMGFAPDLVAGTPNVVADPTGKRWHDLIKAGRGSEAAIELIGGFSQGTLPKALFYAPGTKEYQGAWQATIDAAEEFNSPGRFTAFIGYEWTSNTGGNNLHRNVIFRDDAKKASQVVPYTVYPPGSDNPRDLWKWMDSYQTKTGGRVLALAHNGNLSNGIMFPLVESFTGKPSTASTRSSARSGSRSTSSPRRRATARRIRTSRRTTSSRASSAGTRPTSTAAWPRRRRCSSSSTRALR